MSDKSEIEWTDASWNPVRGCDKVSAGCKNCYAETFAERWRGIPGHPFEQGFDLRLVPEALEKPLRWKRRRRIFVNSMSDLFHEGVSFEYIAACFGVMAACSRHTFQILTKRPARAMEFFTSVSARAHEAHSFPVAICVAQASQWLGKGSPEFMPDLIADWPPWPLHNAHIGVSVENQATADERIPLLLRCPAAVRWVSAEPLLGPVDLNRAAWGEGHPHQSIEIQARMVGHRPDWQDGFTPLRALDWVVVGGESGPGARPFDLAWARSIVAQCKAAGVAVFVKQLGSHPRTKDADGFVTLLNLRSRKGGDPTEWPEDLRVREYPEARS